MKDGTKIYEVLRRRDWERIRDGVRGNSKAWRDHPDRMVCRSALKRLIRTRLPVNEFIPSEVEASEPVLADAPAPVMYDEETGEIFDVVSREAEPSKPDGASKEATHDENSNIIKLSPAQFWKKLKENSKLWKVRCSKDEVLEKMKSKFGTDATLAGISAEQRGQLMTEITAEMSSIALPTEMREMIEEKDDVSY